MKEEQELTEYLTKLDIAKKENTTLRKRVEELEDWNRNGMEEFQKAEAKVSELEGMVAGLRDSIKKYKSECLPHPCPDLALRATYREQISKVYAPQ